LRPQGRHIQRKEANRRLLHSLREEESYSHLKLKGGLLTVWGLRGGLFTVWGLRGGLITVWRLRGGLFTIRGS